MPPEQPPGPSRAHPGVDRDSWSLVARTAASRAACCAAVTQTRTPTRLPVGTSIWHVTVESAPAALVVVEAVTPVDSLAALTATVAASVAGSAPAAGGFTLDGWPWGIVAQPQTRTLASNVILTSFLEDRMENIGHYGW